MREAAAVSSLGVVLALVLTRPRVFRVRIGPAHAAAAGVAVMLAFGLVAGEDLVEAVSLLWRPIVTVVSIMVMAATARRIGVLERVANAVIARAQGSTPRLFALVFSLSAVTAAILNNDAAVLLLTPCVVIGVRRCYPDNPRIVVPFAFCVFMAAGVAPFVVSNPMNMILADVVGIGFNSYAASMIPVAVGCWLITFVVLRWLFRNELTSAQPSFVVETAGGGMRSRDRQMLALLVVVLGSYPAVASLGGPIWVVAVVGALIALWLGRRHDVPPADVVRTEVSWETVGFLVGALIVAFGLRNAGVVAHLTSLYEAASLATIGVASAAGSALVNNHPMALINLLALEGSTREAYLAALVGGDLGPRLLPSGSLAGLLWFAGLRVQGVHISVGRFALIGAAVTGPSLAVSLAVLTLP